MKRNVSSDNPLPNTEFAWTRLWVNRRLPISPWSITICSHFFCLQRGTSSSITYLLSSASVTYNRSKIQWRPLETVQYQNSLQFRPVSSFSLSQHVQIATIIHVDHSLLQVPISISNRTKWYYRVKTSSGGTALLCRRPHCAQQTDGETRIHMRTKTPKCHARPSESAILALGSTQ